jgi:hypothetical protein
MGKYRNAVSDDVDSDRAVTRFAGLRMSNVIVSDVYFSRLHPRGLEFVNVHGDVSIIMCNSTS